jgi:ubiquinone/menaquinone biosynthesis C-methylase UbiE
MSVHPVAEKGFASDSINYDLSRPDHQPAAVEKLLESLAIPPGGRLVEIGSGTGKFTAHLLNRKEKWEVICVEPSEVRCHIKLKIDRQDMRTTQKKLQPNVDIRAGTATHIPVEDSSVDAIVCAQVCSYEGSIQR